MIEWHSQLRVSCVANEEIASFREKYLCEELLPLERFLSSLLRWFLLYTAILFNVVGSKYKAIRQDFKIPWIFFMNKFIKVSYASSVQ